MARKTKPKLEYFSNADVPISPAEQIIIYTLHKHNIPYLREVSFKGFKSPKGGHYRYDFFFPHKNLIIEYDGKKYHKSNNVNDSIKNVFCHKHRIRIVRFNAKHYYHLEKELLRLLK